MVESKKTLKDELKEEEQEEEILPEQAENQKIELAEEAKSDELTLPFQRMNIKDFLWRLLIVKKVEVRDAVLRNNNKAVQISYVDGYTIDDQEIEEKVIKTIVDNQTIPIELVKEMNKHRKEVYLYSVSQGIYYSLVRTVIPKLKSGAVIVGVALQQSDYPQPMVTLVHPTQLPSLKAQYEAMQKGRR